MLSEIKEFVKGRFYDIMLFIIVALLILLAFAAGLALGMGIAVYIAMQVLQMDAVYPASGILWA